MPGEGTSWANYMMSTAGGTNSGASSNYSGSSNTNPNAAADHYNQIQYEKSPDYLNNPANFSNPYEQAAASLQAAGAVTSGALSGQALWTKAPRLPDGSIDYAKQNLIDKYDDVYYSSFALNPDGPNPDAWSPTGLIAVSKDPETGEVHHHVVGQSSSHQGDGGPGGPGNPYGYYGGYGPGYSSGIAGFGVNPLAFFQGRGRGKDLGTTMLDPNAVGIQAARAGSDLFSMYSQGIKPFAIDPKTDGILTMLTA